MVQNTVMKLLYRVHLIKEYVIVYGRKIMGNAYREVNTIGDILKIGQIELFKDLIGLL
jgi:hypothetical protein